ncbi:MAG: hypothetical protein ABIH21_05135 [Patescibacteria group bacterium]
MQTPLSANKKPGTLFRKLIKKLGCSFTPEFTPLETLYDWEEKRTLFRLENSGFIILEYINCVLHFKLTTKGIIESLLVTIFETKENLAEEQLCFISFDIPMVINSARKKLRQFLKKAGFKQIHQSLWATTKNIIQELEAILEMFNYDEYIRIFVGK